MSKVITFYMWALLPFTCFSLNLALALDLPGQDTRKKIFNAVVAEIERIDGEGLLARKNRPEKWNETISLLRAQAIAADTPIDFGQVFRKLDATYPNLHAQVVLDETFDIAHLRIRPKFAVRFSAEIINSKQLKINYKISSIETEMMKDFKEANRPAIGDDLLAINGRHIQHWSKENFIYCKFPLREQCEANFFDHFRKGFLSWDWRSPVEYTIRRNGRTWSINIPFEVPSPVNKQATIIHTNSEDANDCPVESDRYEGFLPVYKGLNICAFESSKFPGVTVLRISSFAYRELGKDSKIQSLQDEVDQFFSGYWQAKAPLTKKIIIDVIDNGGGDTPIPWYKIFYSRPFQEQYVQFKKLPEFELDNIRKKLFYDDLGKEIWFSDLKDKAIYSKIKFGDFLPPIPQFCASDDKNCGQGLFSPLPNQFKGDVRIMVNEWCISTCTGFVWSMKDQLKGRVKLVGHPDSGDSAYARLFIDVYLDSSSAEGFRVEISPRPGRTRQNVPEGAILRQQVTATRSTDSKGRIISAKPSTIDSWVPYRYRNFDESWESKVFKQALSL